VVVRPAVWWQLVLLIGGAEAGSGDK